MEQAKQFHEKDLERLRKFRLMDDDFMSKCFENHVECTELVVHIVLNRNDLKIKQVHTQHQIKNLQGRSITMDIYATDEHGKQYNIEIQRVDRGAGAKRARYNSSLMDANITSPGDHYEELAETYVIFITENDVLGHNQGVYHIDRMIQETAEPFGDEAHILYVNGAYQADTPLGLLIRDFHCTNPDEMNYRLLADRARYFKEDEKGVATMCKMMEDMRKEAAKEADLEARISMAQNMLRDGKLSLEDIAKYSQLSLEEVKELALRKNT